MKHCDNCKREIKTTHAVTVAGDMICPFCGQISNQIKVEEAAIWSCPGCGGVLQQNVPFTPICKTCKTKMVGVTCSPSMVRGVGTGNRDLEQGLALLIEAQDEL